MVTTHIVNTVTLTQACWQDRAIALYQRSRTSEMIRLSTELAARLHLLTGRTIAPDAVYVDPDVHTATVRVDGVVFRLRERDLVVIRPCAHCGIGSFASPPIASPADLGYALGAWQPLCPHCVPEDEDSPDW